MSPAATPSRNDPCPCGSGRKYKKCCMGKTAAAGSSGATGEEPRDAVALLMGRVAALLQGGRLEEALDVLREVLRTDPGHGPALYLLGRGLVDLGRREEGIGLLRRAVASTPRRVEYHANLAAALLEDGRTKEASEAAERALALDPGDPLSHATIVTAHDRSNRLDAALAAAERGLARVPDDDALCLSWARVQQRRGALDAARERLEAILARSSLADIRAQSCVMLGQVLDRLGRHREAFRAFVDAGVEELRRPQAALFDQGLLARRIAMYRTGLTPDHLTRFAAGALDDDLPAPAFLVGFARSGTTMLEQVFAAHPDVVTSDEKPLLRSVRAELGRLFEGSDVPSMIARLDREQTLALRAAYWRTVEAETGATPGRPFVLDKNPMDLIEIGLINAIFPDARVIVAIRDPRDVCRSCFMQSFGLNEAMINFVSLERTVALYADTMDLWLHLRPMLTLRFLEVRYEDAVADLETTARRMLEFVGLAWNDDVLAFHERARRRVISTPSAAQVIEPVHDRSIGRWRNYAEEFEPYLDRLAPFVEAFGYA